MHIITTISGDTFGAVCPPHFLCLTINNQNNETENQVWVAAEPAQSNVEKNVSDVELARRVGVSRQTINAIVNGRSDPSLSRLHEVRTQLAQGEPRDGTTRIQERTH